MVNDSEQPETQAASQFEKNRFFDGKLMTAADMEAEQRYHAGRLELVTRHTTSAGILRGLGVRSIESSDGELTVSVDAGVAIDGSGRPIVVETPTTKTLPAPEGEECHLFVRFDETALESVPVPDADGPVSETASNRLRESFELTYRERPPDREPVPGLDVDLSADDPSALAGRIAAAYHDTHRTNEPSRTDAAVYLGGFERQSGGNWVRSETAPQPEYGLNHDLLYGLLVDHLADTENPHRTEIEAEPPEPELDPTELEGIHERVDYLQSELADLKARQQTTTTHLLRKTLETTARQFRSTAERFADHDGSVSKAAREIAHQVEAASHNEVHADPDRYITTVADLSSLFVDIGDQLVGTAREETADRYLDAVAELQSTLADDQPAVEVAIALDGVAEAAVDLEIVYTATKNA
ncbi:hypothetical protein [Halohasta litorea]|uniref:Halobacterial output domain-containing protein n=1 Tax=Halohasta litorea TaxID=869891 RepID=A0ABD6D932_9EURY|nr:hypothetical protein [Halohasta litorea]